MTTVADLWSGELDPALVEAAARLDLVLKRGVVGPVLLELYLNHSTGDTDTSEHRCEIMLGVRRDAPTEVALVALHHERQWEFSDQLTWVCVAPDLAGEGGRDAQALADLLNRLELAWDKPNDLVIGEATSRHIAAGDIASYPFCAHNGRLAIARVSPSLGPGMPSSAVPVPVDGSVVHRARTSIWFADRAASWTGLRRLPDDQVPGAAAPGGVASLTAVGFGGEAPCQTAVFGFTANGTPALLGLRFYRDNGLDVLSPTLLAFDVALAEREAVATAAWRALDYERFVCRNPPCFRATGDGRILAEGDGDDDDVVEPIAPEDGVFLLASTCVGWEAAVWLVVAAD